MVGLHYAAATALLAAAALVRTQASMPSAVVEAGEDPPLPAIVLEAFSFGFTSVVVDGMFLSALTDAAIEHVPEGGVRASQFAFYDRATTLDPLFLEAYVEGARFLSVVRNDAEGAVLLAEKGLRVQRDVVPGLRPQGSPFLWPSFFSLPFAAGYLYLFERPDLARAAVVFSEAARSAEAPAFIQSLTAKLTDRKRRFEVGLQVLNSMKTSARTEAEQLRYEARIKNLYLIQFLDQFRAEFEGFLSEQAEYRAAVTFPPAQMKALFDRFVKKNRLEAVDPYGGRVHVDESGQVTSTTPYESEMGLR